MKFFNNMKIGAKLVMSFAVVICLMILSLVYVFSLLKSSQKMGDVLYKNYGNAEGEVGMAYAEFQLVKVELRNVLYVFDEDKNKQSDSIAAMNEAKQHMAEYVQQAEDDLVEEESIQQLQEATKYVNEYIADADKCIELVKGGDNAGARKVLLEDAVDSANKAQEKIEELFVTLDKHALEELDKVTAASNTYTIIVIVMSVLDAVIALIICMLITRGIHRPLQEMGRVAEKLSEGDLDVRIDFKSTNEFGKLAESFRQMIQNIREQAMHLDQVAHGDLSITVVPKSEKDVMGNAIATMIRDNSHMFNMMRESSVQVSTGAQEVAAASQALAQGSTEQASAIEEITASINAIEEKIKQSASRAGEANRLVSDAKTEAEGGNQQMAEMIDAMNQINEASENISKIIKVIDDIAFQTNILALNAAVEAARAGNQGKGFAVVADEVRSLAGKSAQAASETAELIEDSIAKVSRGSKLAEETAEALRSIMNSVEQSVSLVEEIANASSEQASAVAQIDIGLTQVSQVVQTNSATSEQCASSSEELSNQAIQLQENLSAFRLKEETGNHGYYLGADQQRETPKYPNNYQESNERIISLEDNYGKY